MFCQVSASHALVWAWIKFTSRWTLGIGMFFWRWLPLPPFPLAGVVLCLFEFIALAACVFLCVFPVRVDSEALPFHKWAVENLQVGPSASCPCVCFLCVSVRALWLFLNGKLLSIQSLRPAREQIIPVCTHTQTNSRFMQRLTQQTWHRKSWRMQERKTMGLWYIVLLEVKRRKGGRKALRMGRALEGRPVNSLKAERGNDAESKQNKRVNVFVRRHKQPLSPATITGRSHITRGI